MPNNKRGLCLLTGEYAPLVKCHIIPKALTKPEETDAPLLQSTHGFGPKRRWSSWYDQGIVSRAGEDILSKIDDDAIKFLRDYKLIWQSWGKSNPFITVPEIAPDDWSIRTIRPKDSSVFQRFIISILWRASVSKIQDMQEIKLNKESEIKAKKIVLGEIEPSLDFLPMSLTQLSTIGLKQNMTPIVITKRIPSVGSEPEYYIKIFRLFLDGLIIHVHRENETYPHVENNPSFVGSCGELVISSVIYDKSFQHENLIANMFETYLGPLTRDTKM